MELSTLLSDGVILQRNEEISLYGFVSNTTETTDILITIEFAGQKKAASLVRMEALKQYSHR